MRTTITFDDDVAAAISELQATRHVGVSAVVNDLIRRALVPRSPRAPFKQETAALGARLDVSNVAEVLDLLDEVP